jgi:hypothetical protein
MELSHGNPVLALQTEGALRGCFRDGKWAVAVADHSFLVEQVLDSAQTLEHGDEGGRSLDQEEERIEGDTEESQRGEQGLEGERGAVDFADDGEAAEGD